MKYKKNFRPKPTAEQHFSNFKRNKQIIPHKLYEVFYRFTKKEPELFTINLERDQTVYDEELVHQEGIQYRAWNPTRSKLAAGILNDLNQTGFKKGEKILYLGSSTGTTISHISDMIGYDGKIYGIEFAPRMLRELVFLSERRENIIPILEDANHPEKYCHLLSQVDYVYQDIAQRNQAEIFLKNMKWFLKKGGFGILCVKSRSIDIRKTPKEIYKEIRLKLEEHATIVDFKILDPYEKDHCMFLVKNKNETSN